MKQQNSDETEITFILLTKIPMNLTLLRKFSLFSSEDGSRGGGGT